MCLQDLNQLKSGHWKTDMSYTQRYAELARQGLEGLKNAPDRHSRVWWSEFIVLQITSAFRMSRIEETI